MTTPHCRLYKALFMAMLTVVFSFTTGCGSGGFILQKKDLTAINNRLAGIENDLWRQSKETENLLEECREEQQRMAECIEEHSVSPEKLEELKDLIKANHEETCSKLAATRQASTKNDPKVKSRPTPNPQPQTNSWSEGSKKSG